MLCSLALPGVNIVTNSPEVQHPLSPEGRDTSGIPPVQHLNPVLFQQSRVSLAEQKPWVRTRWYRNTSGQTSPCLWGTCLESAPPHDRLLTNAWSDLLSVWILQTKQVPERAGFSVRRGSAFARLSTHALFLAVLRYHCPKPVWDPCLGTHDLDTHSDVQSIQFNSCSQFPTTA